MSATPTCKTYRCQAKQAVPPFHYRVLSPYRNAATSAKQQRLELMARLHPGRKTSIAVSGAASQMVNAESSATAVTLAKRKITGKTVLITGGSQGVGKALAKMYAKKGFNVVVAAREPTRLQQVADACSAQRGVEGSCMAVPTDLTDLAQVQRLHEAVTSSYETLDLLVCNAGVCTTGKLEDTPIEEAQKLMDINFFGSFYPIKTFLPDLLEAAKAAPNPEEKPTIAVVNSFAARLPIPGLSLYCASKYALQGFVDTLRYELQPAGIHVAQVHPGLVQSDFLERAQYYGEAGAKGRASVEQAFSANTAQTPEEVARAVVDAVECRKNEVVVGPVFTGMLETYRLTGLNALAAMG